MQGKSPSAVTQLLLIMRINAANVNNAQQTCHAVIGLSPVVSSVCSDVTYIHSEKTTVDWLRQNHL